MRYSKLNKGGMYDAIMKYMAGGKYMKEGGTDFGNLSVKAGIDKNPEVTYADKIAGATMDEGGRLYRVGGAVPKYSNGTAGLNGDEEDPEKKTKKPAKLPFFKNKGLRFSKKRGRAENERLYDELIERYLDPEIGTGVGDAHSLARIAGDPDDQARLDRKYAQMGRITDREIRAQNRFLRRGLKPGTGLPTGLAKLARNRREHLATRQRFLNDEIKDLRVGDRNQAAVQEMIDRGMEIPMPTYLGHFSF
jgi:hypothetical protein